MALEPNSTFGNYHIGEVIGEGGMGQVYRATDTTLDREVAIKVLPESFAQDADRVSRFEREAKTLASLNHPNIAQIYGLEKQGEKEGDITIGIVMELVEGPTLADRIAQGPIASQEALRIAKQIIDGLEAAHARGIVHRDLKPANIKVKADGLVKILDFGIGKPIDIQGASGSQTPTQITPAVTETGVIMGTAAYMSPEQARGKFVDERTDIWAFGCILFEMLTGQPAFAGEDVAQTLAMAPGGDWVAYHADDTGQYGVYIERYPQLGSRTLVSDADGGWGAWWSPDGSELYYRRLGDGAMMAVSVQTSPALVVGNPEMLFESNNYSPLTTPGEGAPSDKRWGIAPDGRFLMIKENTSNENGATKDIIIVQNWTEELKRLVPTE